MTIVKSADVIIGLYGIISLLYYLSVLSLLIICTKGRRVISHRIFRTPPSKLKPYIVDMMFNGKFISCTSRGFIATLLDLIRRRVVCIKEGTIKICNREVDRLERVVLNFVSKFNNLHIEEAVNMINHSPEIVESSVDEFIRESKKFLKPFIRRVYSTDKYKAFLLSTYAFIVISFIILFIYLRIRPSDRTFPALVIINDIIVFLAAAWAPEWFFAEFTPEGRVIVRRWASFKRYLTSSEIKKRTPESTELWDELLIYAIAFGDPTSVMREFTKKWPKAKEGIIMKLVEDPLFVSFINNIYRVCRRARL